MTSSHDSLVSTIEFVLRTMRYSNSYRDTAEQIAERLRDRNWVDADAEALASENARLSAELASARVQINSLILQWKAKEKRASKT